MRFFFLSFALSFCCFFFVLSSHFEAFLYYFVQEKLFSFFVTDTNVLAARFLSTSLFFAFLLYFPFLGFIIFYLVLPIFNVSRYFQRLRGFATIFYLFSLSSFVNHFDLYSFTQTFRGSCMPSKIASVDFSSVIAQYRGSFWDFFGTLCLFYLVLFSFFEGKSVTQNIIYRFYFQTPTSPPISYIQFKFEYFWQVFRSIWLIRAFFVVLSYYFFGGDSLISDARVFFLSVFCREVLIRRTRGFFFCQSRYEFKLRHDRRKLSLNQCKVILCMYLRSFCLILLEGNSIGKK